MSNRIYRVQTLRTTVPESSTLLQGQARVGFAASPGARRKINTCENFFPGSAHRTKKPIPRRSAQAWPLTCKPTVAINNVRNARDKPIALDGALEDRTGQQKLSAGSWRPEFRHRIAIVYAGIYRPWGINFWGD